MAVRRAALSLVVSSTLFAFMAAGTKFATRRLPGAEVALMRFLIGIAVTGGVVSAGISHIRPSRWGWLVARGLFGGISAVTYFVAIQTSPVGVATLLNQTQPVYTMLFSWALLGERPRRTAFAALLLALAGVTVIVAAGKHGQPTSGWAGLAWHGTRGEFLGIVSAIASGVAVTSIRAARRERSDGTPSETAWSVFFSFSLGGALISVPMVLPPFGHWVAPTAAEWALLLTVGLVSTGAQVIMSTSLRHLTGAQGGIIAQLTVPITVVLGISLLGESLSVGFLVGAALTIGGVLMAILQAPARAAARAVP